ncbi:hypothetical protein DAPPUDRAFT_254556 [Daphnia pulex]|uniref:Vitellogenin domain-containing protein n=1 Tax=Daphnia pulex TaxID=6669 RepID=E9H7B4_DAPPU|nr:hypothetical protein DAPPUDRAFT_254556 [Daphnia pulex]|eukprot:EFX72397.1 hypothetical protein DAPPUDRAFT_254556 [Daphnia pulex]
MEQSKKFVLLKAFLPGTSFEFYKKRIEKEMRINGYYHPQQIVVRVLDELLPTMRSDITPKMYQEMEEAKKNSWRNDQNRQVRLEAASRLSQLVFGQERVDPLFYKIYTKIKKTENSSFRETSLHALRAVITQAGDKMSEPIRKSILAKKTRSAAAGCFGALFRHLPADELVTLFNDYLIQDDPSLDWTLRHGKSACLSVALKEAAENVYTPE